MAKALAKKVATPVKKSTAKPKAKTSVNIVKVSEDILNKLKSLNIEHQLQAELEWCIGSFRFDQNPKGLLEALKNALVVLKKEHTKKTKGVTATLLTTIENALA